MRSIVVLAILLCCGLSAAETTLTPPTDDPIVMAARLANQRYHLNKAALLRILATKEKIKNIHDKKGIAARVDAIARSANLNDSAFIPHIMPFLDPVLNTKEEIIAAIDALGKLNAREAIPTLSFYCTDETGKYKAMRMPAVNALERLKALEAQTHISQIQQDNTGLKTSSIVQISKFDSHEAGSLLVDALLHHEDSHTRRMAAIALGDLGDLNHGDALVRALTDRNPGVRRFAAESIRRLEYKPAVIYLIAALEANVAGKHIYSTFLALTNEDIGFNPLANRINRLNAIERAYEWYALNAADYRE